MLQAFAYWADFCAHIDRPELVEDPRFGSHEDLAANAGDARAIIQEAISGQPLEYWREKLATLAGQWAICQDTLEVAADPQVRANGYMVETQTADGTPFELVAAPVQFDGEPPTTNRSPEFNEHGDEILQELGLDTEAILELKAAGAVA